MQSWKKAVVFGSIGVGAVLIVTGRRPLGMAFTAGGLAVLASEYPEKFEAVWENAPDYLQKGMQIFATLTEAGRRFRRGSRAAQRQRLARSAFAIRLVDRIAVETSAHFDDLALQGEAETGAVSWSSKASMRLRLLDLRKLFQQTRAAVPAKYRVVILGRVDFLRRFEMPHRLLEQRGHSVRWTSGAHLLLGLPLAQQAHAVLLFVGIGEAQEHTLRLGVSVGSLAGELIGDGQAQDAQRGLVLRIDGQDVVANRLRLLRLIQMPIVFRLRDGLGNPILRNRFQLEFHEILPSVKSSTASMPRSPFPAPLLHNIERRSAR